MNKKINSNIHPLDVTFNWKETDCDSLDLIDCTYMCIWHHISEACDLSNLPYAPKLKSLIINFSNIESLLGIEKYSFLENLELHRVSKLQSISSLKNLPSLKSLSLFNAKKIFDFSDLSALVTLEQLKLCDSGDIKNLNFIHHLNLLSEFSFAGSNVVDGNLSVLLCGNNNLKWCGFNSKKHYTHTMDKINHILSTKDK